MPALNKGGEAAETKQLQGGEAEANWTLRDQDFDKSSRSVALGREREGER